MAVTSQRDQLPRIDVLNRVLELPVIERVLEKSMSTYFRVKDSHQLVHWILSTAENSISIISKQAMPIAAPIANKFSSGIEFVDNKLCMELDKIEEKVPIVKETPEQILEKSYILASQTVKPVVSTISYANELIFLQAISLKNISWNKANQILSTHYGSVVVDRLDSTALIVDKLIDRYFPAVDDEQLNTGPMSNEEDKLMHTLQTVGKLSNKAARRVYRNVVKNLQTLNKDKVKIYITNLIEFLQITQYIQAVNSKVQQLTSTPKNTLKANVRQETGNGHVKKE